MSAREQALGDVQGALAAYESSPALMITCEGPDLVLTSANAAAREVLDGLDSFGKPARTIAPALTHQLALDVAARVLVSGVTECTAAWRFRQVGDGGEPHDLFYDLTVSPWRGEGDAVRGVLVHGVDVTESVLGEPDALATGHLEQVVSLQDALLPQWLPVLPRVEIAGCYLVGQDEATAGGDWFDVVERPDGRVALVVGDVVGHGVVAAAAMGQLRSVAHERLCHDPDLERAMRDLDAFARTVPAARAATVCVVVLDPGTGAVEYCTAGHPPPLVVPWMAGRSRHLPGTGAAPLATSGTMNVARERLGHDELLVLYTDGIVQRPGRTVTRSTVELGQVAADAAAGRHHPGQGIEGRVDRVCAQTLDLMTRHTGYSDDITLLAAQMSRTCRQVHLEVAADASAVRLALREVGTLMHELRVRELDHIAVKHVVDELVDNVVAHAYPEGGDSARVRLDAELLETGELQICIQDWGTWRQAAEGSVTDERRGLAIARAMVDRLDIDAGESGTVVTIRHRLSRPARMLTGVDTAAERLPDGGVDRPFGLRAQGGGRLDVSGPVDAGHVPVLRTALREAAGSHRLVLDLERVTLLPSAAVQALYAARQEAGERGQGLVLFAPPGSPAQHVLELVRLPYSLTDPDRP